MTRRRSLWIPIAGISFLLATAAPAEDDVFADVISRELNGIAYNSRNDSEEELHKAAVTNSDLRLRHLLLHETADNELKICFALHLLRRRIEDARRRKEPDGLLLKQQAELVKAYLALHSQKAKRNADVKPSEPDKKHGDAANDGAAAKRLWHGNRITPEQPFPARVVGVTTSWVGYALLLGEISDDKPRYCTAQLFATSKLEYPLVPDKAAFAAFSGGGASGKWATYLNPGVAVDTFNRGIGIDTMGSRFGEKDFVGKCYPKWIEAARLAKQAD